MSEVSCGSRPCVRLLLSASRCASITAGFSTPFSQTATHCGRAAPRQGYGLTLQATDAISQAEPDYQAAPRESCFCWCETFLHGVQQ